MEPKQGNNGRCVQISTQYYFADKGRKKKKGVKRGGVLITFHRK